MTGERTGVPTIAFAAMRARRQLASSLLVLALGAIAPATAPADGDPASDLLPSLDYYLPYMPKVQAGQAAQLQGLIAAAKKQGIAFKVAVIATPVDLGAVPFLFGKPQAYAQFLYGEIRTFVDGERGTLLIVMPGRHGAGAVGRLATPAVKAALARIRFAPKATPTQLAQGAVAAMREIATLNRRTLPSGSASGGGSGGTVIVVVVIAAALGLAGIVLILRGRRGPPAPPSGAA